MVIPKAHSPELIKRARDIVNNLLQYARPADYAGYVTSVDVNQLLTDSSKLIQHLIKSSRIRLNFDYAAIGEIEINPQELQQVFVNLLVNAIHTVDQNTGIVTITTRDWNERGVIVTITDNGAGIPTRDLGKIFNPFFPPKNNLKVPDWVCRSATG